MSPHCLTSRSFDSLYRLQRFSTYAEQCLLRIHLTAQSYNKPDDEFDARMATLDQLVIGQCLSKIRTKRDSIWARYFGSGAKIPVAAWDPKDGPEEILYRPQKVISDIFLKRFQKPDYFEPVPNPTRTYRMRGQGLSVVFRMLQYSLQCVDVALNEKQSDLPRLLNRHHALLKNMPEEIWQIESLKAILKNGTDTFS